MRRAQVEIMGLLVIVIIISILLIFAISVLIKPDRDIVEPISDKTLASGLVSAILYTDSACNVGKSDSRFMDLFEDCALYQPDGSDYLTCNGDKSCKFAETKTKDILENTLGKWEKPYEFQVIGPSNDVAISIVGDTPRTGSVKTFKQTLRIKQGIMEIRLCVGGPCNLS